MLIPQLGIKTSVAIKPLTPIETVLPFLTQHSHLVNMVLIMTVEPGFGGQRFMNDMMPKVSAVRNKFPDMDIQVDGGLDVDTCQTAKLIKPVRLSFLT